MLVCAFITIFPHETRIKLTTTMTENLKTVFFKLLRNIVLLMMFGSLIGCDAVKLKAPEVIFQKEKPVFEVNKQCVSNCYNTPTTVTLIKTLTICMLPI